MTNQELIERLQEVAKDPLKRVIFQALVWLFVLKASVKRIVRVIRGLFLQPCFLRGQIQTLLTATEVRPQAGGLAELALYITQKTLEIIGAIKLEIFCRYFFQFQAHLLDGSYHI